MKTMKVLLLAIAVMSLPIAFSQSAFCQSAPNIDGTDPSSLADGDSGTITIYGENLANSDGSCGSVQWYTATDSNAVTGFATEVDGQITGCDPYGTWITMSYDVTEAAGSGYDAIMSLVVQTDGGGPTYSPDIDVYDPE